MGVDADELLAIKNGAWTFDKVMEFKDIMENKLDEEYARQKKLVAMGEPTPIPREVDKVKLNALYHQLYNEYWDEQREVGLAEAKKFLRENPLDLSEYG
jgi:hypothetical protein